MSNYIYKMVSKDNKVIYIGKTINIDQRLRQHMMDKDKKWFKTVNKIYYAECLNKTDMDIYEIYYINKLMPLYNKQSVNNVGFSKILDELNFIESSFNVKTELSKINKKDNQREKLQQENKNLTSKYWYNKINEYTQYYEIGNSYIENEELLNLYKDNIRAEDLFKLLKGLQFMVYKDPCILCNYQDIKDIHQYSDICITLISFSSKHYNYTMEEFINNLLNNIIVPLKFLDEEDVNKINNLRINEYCLFNNIAVINNFK